MAWLKAIWMSEIYRQELSSIYEIDSDWLEWRREGRLSKNSKRKIMALIDELKEILGKRRKANWKNHQKLSWKWGEDRYADERRTVIEHQRRKISGMRNMIPNEEGGAYHYCV